MTISYSGDPTASTLDEVRFRLQDIDITAALFSDEEINYFLTTQRNTDYATAAGAEVLAARYAGTPGSRTLGDVTVTYADMADRYSKLAVTIRQLAASSRTSIPVPWAGGLDVDPVMPNSAAWANNSTGPISDPAPPWPSD